MTPVSPNLAPLEAGTRALVLGLGRAGLSCARYLQRRGLAVRVADTRAQPPGGEALRAKVPDAELRTGAFEPSLLDGVAQVVISPGLSLHEPVAAEAVRRGLPVVGDIELFAREAQAPIAAVTGTNGKSTVTALLAVAFAGSAYTKINDGRAQERSVVVTEEVPVFSGPSEDATIQFKIHEGTIVSVRDDRGGWVRVDLPGDLSGWVETETVERI